MQQYAIEIDDINFKIQTNQFIQNNNKNPNSGKEKLFNNKKFNNIGYQKKGKNGFICPTKTFNLIFIKLDSIQHKYLYNKIPRGLKSNIPLC